ncbi:NADPH-dependent ferric siderophore reductase, contains FAD-binding and SIP domains [Streptomyces sp. LaPpAH-199]|uniref:siderophore-interacting protein n=1 Tax=Streptomyces TaxID=1883 RepID=UPI0008915193|nr:siderophore-interacting protein [Streptomyces sp. LaPpAH-199]MYW79727.1 SIP domain-containing protein [Streptomyces sp. SID8369]SDD52879.1 NADPH-dependent ferric siderophore reductase, contains FAD-binding and SIP domains [Streptomyces sp. LaPpAH-199]
MAAQRAYTTHPLVLRRVTVRRVHEVTPRMRRVVLGGADLAAFTRDGVDRPAFAAPGFDDHVKLILASDGDVRAALPAQLPHGIEWTPAEHRVTRDYTPRRVDPDAGELHLDFVVHGDGPAEAWSASAREGDELWFVGPKSSLRLPERLDWIHLVGDETALPAIGRFLDERPLDAPAHVLVTVSHDEARQELALRDGDTVTWVVAEPGDAAALEAAVRALPVPPGEGYVWAAAESRALLPVRRYLQRERKLPKDRVNITGYWHREKAAAPQAPDAAEAPGAQAAAPIPSPLPWLVARAALRLGVVDAVADAPGLSADALAARVGVAGPGLGVLLPLLASYDVVVDAGDGTGLRLGAAGEELLDDHEREEYTGHEAELLLALTQLAPALKEGTSPWRLASGTTLHEAVTGDAERYGELVEECEQLVFLLDGLTADPLWEGVGSCLLTGPGSASVAAALDDAGRRPRLLIAEDAGPAEVLRGHVPAPDRVAWSAGPADVAVAAKALAHRTDEEAVALLARLAEWTSTTVLVEASRPDNLSPHAAEAALHAYTATGSPLRDSAAVAALAERSGWRVERTVALGWGTEATVLRRA